MRTLTIGRSSGNDVVLQDDFVSGSHCSITLDEKGSFYLQDLGSSNGTYVNGKRVQQAWLRSNDIVRIGETIIPWQEYFQTQGEDHLNGNIIRKVTFGRAPDNDVVIADDFVSSHHAEIMATDQHEFLVHDLNSTNGTYVNDRRVTSALLVPGDRLRLAKRTLEWTMFLSTPSSGEIEEEKKHRKPMKAWHWVLVAVGALLAVTLVIWGILILNDTPSGDDPETIKEDSVKIGNFTDMVKVVERSVFMVKSYDRHGNVMQGTGFFIDENGTGVTSYHVVEGGTKWVIRTTDGNTYEVEDLLVRNKKYDYVIFSINTAQKMPFLKRAKALPDKGAEIFVLGNPKGIESTLTKGIISGFKGGDETDIMNGNFINGHNFLQIDVAISHGSSGSPVLNMNGEVVGIATLSFQEAECINCNFALNIQLLEGYMR